MSTANTSRGTLRFEYKSVVDELNIIAELAAPFLAPGAAQQLAAFQSNLTQHQKNGSRLSAWTWEIHEDVPIQTRASAGEYEPDSKGGHHVYASIDGKWEIKTVDPGKRSREPKEFDLLGGASIRVRLRETRKIGVPHAPRSKNDRLLGLWRMELGDASSPGCHFHIQVLGQRSRGPFPSSLPVPRLPSLFVTPAAAIEYVLGELFQDKWLQRVQAQGPQFARWANLQRPIFERLLEWQLSCVRDNSMPSPWTQLKRAKPPQSLFMKT